MQHLPPCPKCGSRQRLEMDEEFGFAQFVCWAGHNNGYRAPGGELTPVGVANPDSPIPRERARAFRPPMRNWHLWTLSKRQ